jgi:hypothetical protein
MHYVPCIKFCITTFAVKDEHPGIASVLLRRHATEMEETASFLDAKEREDTCQFDIYMSKGYFIIV